MTIQTTGRCDPRDEGAVGFRALPRPRGEVAGPAAAPSPAGTRPSRPAERRGPVRPGDRRGPGTTPVLPPVRPGVAGGRSGTDDHRCRPLPASAPSSAVVLRRRRAVAGAVLAAVLGALLALAVSLVPAEGPGDGAVLDAPVTVTVVGVGESLTDVARRATPASDPSAVASRIRELNGLSSSAIEPGRPLLVPSGG